MAWVWYLCGFGGGISPLTHFYRCCFFCYYVCMKIKVGLTFEEFIDVMYLLDQKHFSRGKKHLKLCTGERLKYVGDGVIEVMGYSAVSSFGDYLSDYLTGKNYKPFINYLVVYGKLRNKLRNPAKFNRYS
jgi:hypothetical protein